MNLSSENAVKERENESLLVLQHSETYCPYTKHSYLFANTPSGELIWFCTLIFL